MSQHYNEIEQRYRLILESMSEGVYGLDREGHATFVNKAAERLTGWSSDELIGKSIHTFHHHSYEDGTHYPQSECSIYLCLQDGLAKFCDNEVFWCKDGTSFPVDYSSTPIIENGVVHGAVVVFKDIRDRRRAEKNLKEAFDQVRLLKERLQAENLYLQEEISIEHESEIIGQSDVIQELHKQLTLVAPTQANALIQGENGTGKELIARAIHNMSDRRDRPMVKLNCGAIPEGLVDSELFGHEKGAFTGAINQRIGRFELSDGGTLFLDEVSELSMDAQVKLLRVLQEGEFERVGGSRSISVDVRVIAASNRHLLQAVEEGRFRMDLYYRLNVFPILIAPLRERLSDIPILAAHFANMASHRFGKTFYGIAPKSMHELGAYHWPGNVRELQNRIEHAVILHTSGLLYVPNLSGSDIQESPALNTEKDRPVTLHEAERKHILQALSYCKGTIAGEQGAAKVLGLPPSTLRSRMKKLGMN